MYSTIDDNILTYPKNRLFLDSERETEMEISSLVLASDHFLLFMGEGVGE